MTAGEEPSLIAWLLQPIDSTRPHEVGILLSWHGRIMVLAWGVIIPLGIVTARFFKILPWQNWPEELDNPTWWQLHWKGQTAALVLTALGIILILFANHHASHPLHRWFGWSIAALGIGQALSGLWRGTKGGPTARAADGSPHGDHFDMTQRRLVFEKLHKSLGYGLLLAGITAVFTGLWAANGPIWMWLVILAWWLVLALVASILERYVGAYDTYQAIWGPDPDLPGNRKNYPSFGAIRPGDQPRIWFRKQINRH